MEGAPNSNRFKLSQDQFVKDQTDGSYTSPSFPAATDSDTKNDDFSDFEVDDVHTALTPPSAGDDDEQDGGSGAESENADSDDSKHSVKVI